MKSWFRIFGTVLLVGAFICGPIQLGLVIVAIAHQDIPPWWGGLSLGVFLVVITTGVWLTDRWWR